MHLIHVLLCVVHLWTHIYASYSRISGYMRLVCHDELFIHVLLDINMILWNHVLLI